MADRLIVIGASGFGRETLDVVEAVNRAADDPVWEIVGVVDDDPSEINLLRLKDRGVAYLGTLGTLDSVTESCLAVGVGSPSARRAIVQRVGELARWATLVHPSAVLGSRVRLGIGVVVCAGASVGTNVEVADHVHLNPHAVIGHDTRLGEFVSVNPNATISGECVVEPGALVGAAAVVLQGLRVGRGSTVGGSACVVRDVPAGVVVKGVPAR